MKKAELAGALLFASTLQFFAVIFIAQSMIPGYNIYDSFISELGVGETAALFNTSVIILSLALILSALLLHSISTTKRFALLIAAIGICGIGIALFPLNNQPLHTIISGTAFILSILAVVSTYEILPKSFNFASILIGLVSLVALLLLITNNFFGLGQGGVERVFVYLNLIFTALFGLYLIKKT